MRITNTQNVPREPRFRDLIVPFREGEVLVEGDQSQAESRIVAWKAGDTTLITMFENGEKVHEYVGSLMFSKTITKKTTPEEYAVSKMISHMSNYGGSYFKIAQVILDDLGIAFPTDECRRRQNIYYQQFPRIRSVYQAEIENELKTSMRRLKSITGWSRKFYQPWGKDLLRAAYAHYAQNPVAFITNQGLNRLVEWGWEDHIYMQCHDAIIMSVPEKKMEEAGRAIKKALTHTFTIKGRPLTIPIDISWGRRWGSMEELHVEDISKAA